MKVTFAQLRLLIHVVRLGSVGAAARELGLTQSGASQAIAALEKVLGAEVLTRTRNGVAATAFGQSILLDAQTALEAVGRIAGKSQAVVALPVPSFHIASIQSVADCLVPAWRKQFQRLYPQIEVGVFEGNHREVGEWVVQGLADVGLTSIIPPGLSSEILRREELLVVGRSSDPALRCEAVPLDTLSSSSIILAGASEPIMNDLFSERAMAPPRGVVTHDMATALEMVRRGLGLTVFSETSFPRGDMHDLRTRPINPRIHRTLHAVFRPGAASSESCRRFVEIARSAEKTERHQ